MRTCSDRSVAASMTRRAYLNAALGCKAVDTCNESIIPHHITGDFLLTVSTRKHHCGADFRKAACIIKFPRTQLVGLVINWRITTNDFKHSWLRCLLQPARKPSSSAGRPIGPRLHTGPRSFRYQGLRPVARACKHLSGVLWAHGTCLRRLLVQLQ